MNSELFSFTKGSCKKVLRFTTLPPPSVLSDHLIFVRLKMYRSNYFWLSPPLPPGRPLNIFVESQDAEHTNSWEPGTFLLCITLFLFTIILRYKHVESFTISNINFLTNYKNIVFCSERNILHKIAKTTYKIIYNDYDFFRL